MKKMVLILNFSFQFEAMDYHSGLREVYWELYDMDNSAIIHGSGQLPASQVISLFVICRCILIHSLRDKLLLLFRV